MEVIEVESWKEFLRRLEHLEAEQWRAARDGAGHSPLLFRGQSDSTWSLETTLERWPGRSLRLSAYHSALSAIRAEVESRLDRRWDIPTPPEFDSLLDDDFRFWNVVEMNDLYDFMIYVRHHGFPSPLLDWTRSPLIAAHFAFPADTRAEQVAVFAYQEYAGQGKGGWVGRPQVVGLGGNVRTHPRHHLQQAQYTISLERTGSKWVYCPHEQALDEGGGPVKRRQDLLWKFVLPANARLDALRYLERHNLTAYSLFASKEKLMESLAVRELLLRPR